MTCESSLEEAKQYSDTYKKETQFVLSRCHHHIHLPDKHTGIRVPLSGCRSKKDKTKCKGSFPMSRRLVKQATVICKGNATKYGLRPSGRRNALSSVLSRRQNDWFSGCAPPLALFLKHNTHTGPNLRVPPCSRTHDPECQSDCMDRSEVVKLTAIAQRAQRNTTGYFTGYIQKRQPVGAFEIKQATLNSKFL